MEPPEDPARLLAREVRRVHRLPRTPTWADLLRVAEQRGANVLTSYSLPPWRRGYYHRDQYGAWIVVRYDAPLRVLAHELGHHILEDNASHGVYYRCPLFLDTPAELAAERFAVALLGDR